MLGTMDRSYTTAAHRPDQQFDAWRSIVADAFVPVELDSGAGSARDGFAADCQVRRVGGITVSWMRSVSQLVQRTESQTASAPCGVYFLNFTLDSATTAQQDDRTARVGPGDFVIIDGDRPFRLEFPGAFEQISLTIPKPDLDRMLLDARSATALTIAGDRGIGAIAAAAFTGLARHVGRIDGRAAEAVTGHVLGLLAAALDQEVPRPAARRSALFRALLEDIEEHRSDPDLSLTTVAKRIAISPSYAMKLLAENRTSFGRWLLGRRLDAAWNLLVQAPGITVTEVALQCGFRDPGYFARTFRARFGVTPSDRRAAP